ARLALDAGDAADRVVELDDRRLPARADVEDAPVRVGSCRQHRGGDVGDVHVVTRLRALAVDRRRAVAVQEPHEDRDDARLSVRLLARAVDVAEAQGDVRRAIQTVPRREVLLAGELRRPVRRERPALGALGRRAVALAVDGAAGRREDDARAVPARGLEDAHRPEHVHVRVERRLLDRHADVGLRGEVEDELGPRVVEHRVGVADVRDVQGRGARDALAAAPREVVEHVDLVPSGEERVGDVRADEPRAPGDDRPHRAPRIRAVGVLLAIEGIDGSGKGTQAARLAERAADRGHSVASFSFPMYDGNPFSSAVADYLNGEFGSAEEVHPELAAMLYAGDRFHARPRLVEAVATHDLVVCDRYVGSNAAHQGAKLRGAARARLLDWLEEVEYGEFALPRADLVVLLDAPVALARKLVA